MASFKLHPICLFHTMSTRKHHHRYSFQFWGCVYTLWYDAIVVGFVSLALNALFMVGFLQFILTQYQPRLFIIYVAVGSDLIFAFLASLTLVLGCIFRIVILIIPWIMSNWFHLSVYVIGGIYMIVEVIMERADRPFGTLPILGAMCAFVILIGIHIHLLLVVHLFLDQLRKDQVKHAQGFKSFKINL